MALLNRKWKIENKKWKMLLPFSRYLSVFLGTKSDVLISKGNG